MKIPLYLVDIFYNIAENGGHPYIVGGAVRDYLLGVPVRDFDIEVHGISADLLISILEQYGPVNKVGKSFGVIIFQPKKERATEFSLPRRENKEGRGHKGFIVEVDPTMTPEEAAARRDFTINSMYLDPFIGEIHDPFNGQMDLDDGVLRKTSDAYREDPLRVLRGFQFIARFDLSTELHTLYDSIEMRDEYDTLSKERIWEEWWKWATKGKALGKGLRWLVDTGWIIYYPEISNLIALMQDPEWHPEGNVFIHTRLAVDAIAQKAKEKNWSKKATAIAVFAALCHDFGKVGTTEISDKSGRIIAPGHAEKSEKLAKKFLDRVGAPKWLIRKVLPLVREHMFYIHMPTKRSVRRLANRLAPATINELLRVFYADIKGRKRKGMVPTKTMLNILAISAYAVELEIEDAAPKAILMGRHLLKVGIKPGPAMGRILKDAFEAQLDGAFDNLEGALYWAQERREDV